MNKIDACGFDKAVFFERTVLAELEQWFGHAVMCDLVFLAINSAVRELLLFQNALGLNDITTMRRLSHSMIGVLGQYGALQASQLASRLHYAQSNQLEQDNQIEQGNQIKQDAKALIYAGKVAIELLKQYLSAAKTMAEFA